MLHRDNRQLLFYITSSFGILCSTQYKYICMAHVKTPNRKRKWKCSQVNYWRKFASLLFSSQTLFPRTMSIKNLIRNKKYLQYVWRKQKKVLQEKILRKKENSSQGGIHKPCGPFFGLFDPPPPNVDQFTPITWTIFRNFQPPPPLLSTWFMDAAQYIITK